MTSIYAFDGCVIAGTMAQSALILRARKFAPDVWAFSFAALTLAPLGAFLFFRMMSGSEDAAGFAVMGICVGAIIVGTLLMDAPPRVTPAGLLAVSVAFWAACWPEGFKPPWFYLAAAATALTALCAVTDWKPPFAVRSTLYVWYLWAAAGAAGAALNFKHLFGDSEPLATLSPLDALMIGAQGLLLLHALAGLSLLLPFREFKDESGRLLRNYVSGTGVRWPALAAVIAQAALLAVFGRSGTHVATDLILLSTLAAMAHGAMSNAGEVETEL